MGGQEEQRVEDFFLGSFDFLGGFDGKWQGTNGNCRPGFNLAAVIFKDGSAARIYFIPYFV